MSKPTIYFLGIDMKELADLLGITTQSARNKVHGRTEFTLFELDLMYRRYHFSFEQIKEEIKKLRKEESKHENN